MNREDLLLFPLNMSDEVAIFVKKMQNMVNVVDAAKTKTDKFTAMLQVIHYAIENSRYLTWNNSASTVDLLISYIEEYSDYIYFFHSVKLDKELRFLRAVREFLTIREMQ